MKFLDYPAWIRRAASILAAGFADPVPYNKEGDLAVSKGMLESVCALIYGCWKERDEPALPYRGIPIKHLEKKQ